MQAALKLHHTTLASRRINVELTAGGGGKSNERASKIKERNDRVGVQRGKRAEKEREEAEKNGTLNKDEENVNGFKPQGFGGRAKGDKAEVIKTRGPDVGQKPMRAWGQAGAASASGGAEGLNATSTPPAPAVKRVQEDQSHVQGVSDGSVKVRGGRRVKVNPNVSLPRIIAP
jgi:nucleolar protein 6